MLKNNQTGEITTLDYPDNYYIYNPFVARRINHQVFLYDLTDGREVRIKIDNDIIEPSQIIKNPSYPGDYYTIKKYKQYEIPASEFGTWIATTGFSYVDNSEYSVVVKNQ